MPNHLCLSGVCAKCLWWGGLTEEYTFPKSSSPGEPQPSSFCLESTFRLCFSSCAYHHMLCRLGMWTAHLSTLCMYCHIHSSETTPKRDPLSLRSFETKPSAACKKSELTHILLCCFFFSSLSESFPFSVFWRGPARLHGWSTTYVLGSTACLEAVWENSCSPLPEMEPGMNAAIVHRGCFHLSQNVKAELRCSVIHWHSLVIPCLLCFC